MSARDIALQLLPHFSQNVLAGRVRTYGFYARAIGMNPSTQSMPIGQAMHAIGGACVFACIPVAPLHYVRRADGDHRGIFEHDLTEEQLVLPHYKTLYVAAKFGTYSPDDSFKVEALLRDRLPRAWTPHQIWAHAAVRYMPNAGVTWFERALAFYRELIDRLRDR